MEIRYSFTKADSVHQQTSTTPILTERLTMHLSTDINPGRTGE